MIHRGMRALLALVLLCCVVALEWWSQLDYSLGIFYLFGIVVLATVATRLQIVAAAVACAFIRGLFHSGLSPIETSLRFAMAVFAYAGIGLLIVEMSRGRRNLHAAYTRLHLEQRLRSDAERRLAMLVDSSPAGILTLDARARVVAANRAAHVMLGYRLPDGLIASELSRKTLRRIKWTRPSRHIFHPRLYHRGRPGPAARQLIAALASSRRAL
jgi:PAS domain-containing protein